MYDMGNKERPWYREWWGLLLMILFVLLVLLLLVFAVTIFKRAAEINDRRQEGILMINNPALADNAYSPTLGNKEAPIQIVGFIDFQCHFCRQSYPIISSLLEQYGDQVRFTFRNFPLQDTHPEGYGAALAATCAAEQNKFWTFHDALFNNQDRLSDSTYQQIATNLNLDLTKFNDCVSSKKNSYQIKKDLSDGLELGVKGTPTFFVNGQIASGVITLEQWQLIIQGLLLSTKQ
ncbi:MAG: hypothetical protein COX77_02410 [Candidatus Komeilibacteria bacterium CG_4_10_14_0_2_um_filter_37_10]|uniref:Thioredoxin domain-containing protein n=1 Tax=Candidatus Komeilibacteria bacterium CG_4_10_14_0_2_um_filter_37_10 TaxID=1974470 RepID=A0A2M7VEZ3_9BACT|nr:MAG: hypothetical protein COX77_02410 [Candidatus Komeilibacteria bacterium CG_4_10_14_0_2_um_filter_37_10]